MFKGGVSIAALRLEAWVARSLQAMTVQPLRVVHEGPDAGIWVLGIEGSPVFKNEPGSSP